MNLQTNSWSWNLDGELIKVDGIYNLNFVNSFIETLCTTLNLASVRLINQKIIPLNQVPQRFLSGYNILENSPDRDVKLSSKERSFRPDM